jgi:acyl carrier protein
MTLAATIDLIRAEMRRQYGETLPDEIDATTTWHELGCDPLDVVGISYAAEEAFGIMLPVEVEDCATVGELATMIEDLQPVATCRTTEEPQ